MKYRRMRITAMVCALLLVVSTVLSGCGGNDAGSSPEDTLPIESGVETKAETVPETEAETVPETEAETVPETEAETAASETLPETQPETQPPVETAPPAVTYVQVTGITLTTYEVNLVAGLTTMPIVTMYPANATDKSEIWVSSDTNVATVDMYGNIYGVAPGECTVTVTSRDNSAVFATVKVKVVGDVELTYIDGILIVNKTRGTADRGKRCVGIIVFLRVFDNIGVEVFAFSGSFSYVYLNVANTNAGLILIFLVNMCVANIIYLDNIACSDSVLHINANARVEGGHRGGAYGCGIFSVHVDLGIFCVFVEIISFKANIEPFVRNDLCRVLRAERIAFSVGILNKSYVMGHCHTKCQYR